jgi:Tol biopolymer transport system component
MSSFGAVYAPAQNGGGGWILILRDGTLMAQPFDPVGLKLVGEPVPVAERVGSTPPYGNFSVSASGVLAYRTGSGGTMQLTWLDREGKVLGLAGEPGQYLWLALSPDGQRAAARLGAQGRDVWLLDLVRGVSRRFTFTQGATNTSPVWSPDGSRIVFASNRSGRFDLYKKASTGVGEDELLLQSDQDKTPTDWSRDGRFLVYDSVDSKGATDIWVLPMQGERKPIPFLRTEFIETSGVFSPDGRWIAYVSTEPGIGEVYLRPFVPPGQGGSISSAAASGQWQVSKDGAATTVKPVWRADGRELYYRNSLRSALMAVDVNTSPTLQAGVPHRLFSVPASSPVAITGDGKRFLVGLPQQDTSNTSAITVVLNWQAGLKK